MEAAPFTSKAFSPSAPPIARPFPVRVMYDWLFVVGLTTKNDMREPLAVPVYGSIASTSISPPVDHPDPFQPYICQSPRMSKACVAVGAAAVPCALRMVKYGES